MFYFLHSCLQSLRFGTRLNPTKIVLHIHIRPLANIVDCVQTVTNTLYTQSQISKYDTVKTALAVCSIRPDTDNTIWYLGIGLVILPATGLKISIFHSQTFVYYFYVMQREENQNVILKYKELKRCIQKLQQVLQSMYCALYILVLYISKQYFSI